ncbi:Cna B-type domain-containing protein [Staphylococcus pseudintermedius]|uniref:Cna B-type domain-containing protein n=1 Tax=Staphylococcus pseudintermedius TaxID=283734 RepID=UPI002546618C|nr:Cna B-type domain-containing protein [Staphylococcus pseudintermedius]
MVFILLLNVIAPIFNGSTALAAGQDISSRNVTKLTVSPTTINDGQNAKVRVDFDDKAGKIENGDTIKVSWPTSGDARIQGYNKTIPLIVKGEEVGQVVITTSGATITFNEKVDRLSDVSGFAEFEILGRNLTETTGTDDKTVAINSGNQSTNLTIHKDATGTESVFYYKTGDMQPDDTNHVRWFLNINNEQKPVVKDITIKDQIQGGQQLDLSTLAIQIQGTHPGYYKGETAITAFEKAIPGSKVIVDATNNTIDVFIPQGYASNNNFTISYKTKIMDEKQKEFVNNSQAWYQEYGQPEVSGQEFNHTVQNISANAGIEGTVKGELKILKQDKDTQTPIQNVKFKLTKADGSVIKDGQNEIELTTDAQGIANIKGLSSGKYIVKEVEAPAPYIFDKDKTYPFELKDSDTEGYFTTIDNEKAAEKTKDVTAKKVWEGTEQNHPTIYFKLYQKVADGTETAVENADIKKLENGTTETTWTNLPENDKDGKAIDYVVKEVDEQGKDTTPNGYTKKEDGLTVTNTEKPIEKTSISGEKKWDDNNNQDGKRPDKVTINLLANDKKIQTTEASEASNWKYVFKDLPKQENSKDIDYKVSEEPVEGYQSTVNGTTITNKYTPETTKVDGVKIWDDENDQDGKRPNSVNVNLLANGKQVATKAVTKDTDWKYEFKDLPKYENGQEIEYTVTEDHVADYSTTIDGTKIINKYTPGKTSATVTKHWEDKDDQDGKRPGSINVELYANGEASGKTAQLNNANNWTYTWENLAEKAQGKNITYTVKETTAVKGYETTINDEDFGNIILTNKYTPETTKVEGTKVWDDENDQDGKRPNSVNVNLLANGEPVGMKEVTKDTDWKYEFTNLPKYENGKAIEYTVTEDHVANYSTTIDGTTITNKYTPGKTSATVTKNWDDKNNQDGKRPASIEVELLADGKATGKTATLNEDNNWSHSWQNLAEKAQGKAITYTVKETTDVKGYETTVDNSDIGNLSITNRYTPETTKVEGTKVWDDGDDQDGKRPDKVTVNLLANGETVDSKSISKASDWKYAFTDLPKYENGKVIEYTVTEDHVADYSTTIDGTTITNKYTPGKTSATVTKNWDDKANQDGKRPESIEVELMADGKVTGEKATLNEENNWTHTWQNLAEKSKGEKITYTVKETTDVKGYETILNNNDIGNLNITNKYTPETTKVAGEKIWDDKDNQDGKRPDNVTVNLLANGETVDSKEVSKGSDWKYEFTDLPKYENGKVIDYTVTEDHVADYSTTIDGTTITNKYTPGKTSATVTKHWEDDDNQDGKRPKSIEVELMADGKATGEKATLSADNNWTHTWQDLAEKAQGKAIDYTVKEITELKDYDVKVDNADMGNFVITNKYNKPEEPNQPEKKPETKPSEPNTDKPNTDKPNTDKPNSGEPKQPDTPKASDKPAPEKHNFLSELPKTGTTIIKSWITWVILALLATGSYLVVRQRKQR